MYGLSLMLFQLPKFRAPQLAQARMGVPKLVKNGFKSGSA
jgi:hypothetical protein